MLATTDQPFTAQNKCLTCSGSSAAGVPSSALYWKQPMRSNLKLVQKSTSSRCCSSVSPARGSTGRQRRQGYGGGCLGGTQERGASGGAPGAAAAHLVEQLRATDDRKAPLHVTIACNGNTRSAPGKPEMKVVRSARSGIRSRSVCSSLSVWACSGAV